MHKLRDAPITPTMIRLFPWRRRQRHALGVHEIRVPRSMRVDHEIVVVVVAPKVNGVFVGPAQQALLANAQLIAVCAFPFAESVESLVNAREVVVDGVCDEGQ